MKKMMIAAGAAATMALFANAATSTSFGTGTGFENLTVGANLNTQQGDETGGGGSLYWYSSAAVDGAVDSLVAGDDSNKYLSVDESEPLFRKLAAIIDSSTGESPSVSLVSTNVYFQADVQFTASDAESSSAGGLVTTGDKILVWLQGTEAGATNLIITAAAALGDSTQTDYVVTGVEIDTTAWYTLCIEATTADAGGTTIAAFTVKLCEKGGTLAALTGTSDGGTTTTTTFYSLVDSGTAAATISCAGFKGTGAIDNLDFGMFEAEAAQTFTFEVSVTDAADALDGAAVTIDGVDYAEPLTYEVGKKTSVIIEVPVDDSWTVTSEGNTAAWDENAYTWLVTVDTSAATADSTVAVSIVITSGSGSEYPSYVPAAAQEKYDAWKKKYGYTGDGTGLEKAFLMDADPNEATPEFKITAISIAADGKVTITPADGDTYGNGKVTIKKYSDPAAKTEDANGTFFKATLSL